MLLLIVALAIVVITRVHRAVTNFAAAQSSLSALETVKLEIGQKWEFGINNTETRVRDLEKAANDRIDRRIDKIDRDLVAISSRPEEPLVTLNTGGLRVNMDSLKQKALNRLEAELLQQERHFLDALRTTRGNASEYASRLRLAKEELERRHQVLKKFERALHKNDQDQRELIDSDPILHRVPYTPAHEKLRQLRKDNDALREQVEEAGSKYADQRRLVESMKAPKDLDKLRIPADLPDSVAAQLEREETDLKALIEANWVGQQIAAVRGDMPKALLGAAAILFALILTRLALKTVFYFILAPIASRRSAVALIPQSGGDIEPQGGVSKHESGNVSTVSRAITIDITNELLIHPEYLQSSPHGASSNTHWFLSGQYWLASLAAGLFAMTRMRSDSPAIVVLSSTTDPLSEVGVLIVPFESAVVFQPRHLAGILQRRDAPLRITSHWRLGSLHAWLTLQLRYLVFHGPVTLIVKGCRGVRVEPAEAGRNINQAATIGFSANLSYASRRCETFIGYLSGKQPLLHDSFTGAKGKYIYQEMPHAVGRVGMTGRGIEGVTDALLKVLGI